MGTLCAPQFQGRSYRFPFFVLRVPPWVRGFSTNCLRLCFKKYQYCVFFSMLQSGKFWVLTGQIRLLSGLIFLLSPYAIRKVWSVFRTRLWAFWPYLVFFWFLCLFCWKKFTSINKD